MELCGKTVLITGGAIRFGAALCRAFAAKKARLVIHCLHSRPEAEALCRELGTAHSVTQCDLTDTDAADAMIREFRPDVLVNNAASYARTPLPLEDAASAARQYLVNCFTPVSMLRTLYSVRNGEETAVVNILDSSIASVPADSFSYALSKKMLAEATKAAARQCAPVLRVNAVAPGNMIPPDSLAHLGMKKTADRLPLKRVVDPSDVALAAVFLASVSSITGEVLYVDCGQRLLEGGGAFD